MSSRPRQLRARLANAPLSTSGHRTQGRVAAASKIIGCESVVIVNLFSLPTRSVLDITMAGADEAGWTAARLAILEGLRRSEAILLGWGCAAPSGSARNHHRSQVEWLFAEVSATALPMWTVGGLPRHPSRWQRYTSRAYPALAFDDALARSLCRPLPANPSEALASTTSSK
jgi:hypothetical protein